MSFSEIVSYLPQILDVAVYVIAAASVISKLTPTPKDDSFVAKAKKVVDFLALNLGKSKNKI